MRAYPPALEGDADMRVLDPELANRASALPIAVMPEDPVREAWRQAKEWLAEGNPGFSVCIATANPDAYKVEDILARTPEGLLSTRLTGNYLLDSSKTVVSDMTAIKGFEFSLIMILGLEEGVYPFAKRPEAEVWRDAMRLYVAITRGRDEVRFPYRGKPSRFLSAMGALLDWREGVPFVTAEQPAQPRPVLPGAELAVVIAPSPPTDEVARPDQAVTTGQITEPAVAADTVTEGVRHKIVFLNGYACLCIPRSLSQDQLAAVLSYDLTQLSVDIQMHDEHFVSPIAPLPDHIIRNFLDRRHIMVNFLNEHAPAQAAVRRHTVTRAKASI
jgi:hypothetical protein